MYTRSLFILYATLSTLFSCHAKQNSHIIGLLQVRNEEQVIAQCLRCLSPYVDGMIVLDDGSTDNTVAMLENLAKELPIKKIIKHTASGWETASEKKNRQELLDAGRAIGGTHFILIDADEIFAAPCMQNQWLINSINELLPGQALAFPMVNVWGTIHSYRDDSLCSPYHGIWKDKPIIFCDDGNAAYVGKNIPENIFLHGLRIPGNLECRSLIKIKTVTDLDHCIIHFKWANLDNVIIKKVWYMVLEYMRASEKIKNMCSHAVRNFYNNVEFKGLHPDESGIDLTPVPDSWYHYPACDFSVYEQFHTKRLDDIIRWKEKGITCFDDLIIPLLHQYRYAQ